MCFTCLADGRRVPSERFMRFQIRNWIWIFYRHYPFWPRTMRVALLSAAYIVKSIRVGHLGAVVSGIADGLRLALDGSQSPKQA